VDSYSRQQAWALALKTDRPTDTTLSVLAVNVEDGVTGLSKAILDVELTRPMTTRELDCLGTLAMNAEDLIRTIEALRKRCRRGCGHEPGHSPLPQCR
jgi:hypothetical protein